MMNHLIELISENKGVTDYRINTTRTESYEVFFVHKDLETVRATDTTDTAITIYVDHDGKKGNALFNVYASTTDDEIRQKVADAVETALVINNENYELPANESLSQELPSNLASEPMKALAARTAEAVFAADCYQGGSINALEIFLKRITTSVINSRGIHKSVTKYSAMIEAIPTWTTEEESVELYEAYHFGQFDAAEITAEIDRKMQEVRDRQVAKKPEQPLTCKVVLGAQELTQLLRSIARELNYASVYSHSNAYNKGDMIQKEGTGDKLNITMRSSIPGSHFSALFDDDGTALTDTAIVKDGQAVAYYGSGRFAQYLGEPITGELPCTQVACGTLTEETLKAEPYFEAVSMSGLQLDIYSDYIGGEVRLAYYYDGKTVTPVTGISLSGKLSDALKDMKLSSKEVIRNAYQGPDKAVFTGISIV